MGLGSTCLHAVPSQRRWLGQSRFLFVAMSYSGRQCGQFCSTAMRSMSNLSVEVKAHATKVMLEDDRATGIEYVQGGKTKIARAAREVILAGG